MSATADLVLERRRIRRRLAFWRISAIVVAVASAIVLIPAPDNPALVDHLARIRIDGLILEDPSRDEELARLASADRVKGVIVRINSPGGTVAASESLYEALRRIGEQKPVVAVMSEVGASGAYIAAIAAEHIIARGNTLTGSIGVVTEIPNVAGLMEKLGIGVTRVKSAPLKAEPSFTSLPDEAALEASRALIADSYAWFRDLVSERRKLTGAALEAVADGRVFTGRQAAANGLVDAIGSEQTARQWLAAERGLPEDLRVIDYDWSESPLPWPASLLEESLAGLLPEVPILPAGSRLYAVIH